MVMVTVQGGLVRAGLGRIRFFAESSAEEGRFSTLEEGTGRFFLSSYEDGRQVPPSPEEICAAGGLLWERGYREQPVVVFAQGEALPVLCSAVENRVTAVTAQVGTATFLPKEIPLRFETPLINDPVSLKGADLRMTAVGFGAPYAVVFVDTVGECRWLPLGEALSRLRIFPQGAEVVFAHVQGERRMHLQVLHRDGGRRLVGRDICAALAAAVAVGRCAPDRTVTVPWEEGEFRAVCTKNRTLFLTCPVQVLSS